MLCQQLAQCICIYFFCILIALSVIIKKQFPAMQGPFMVRMNGKCCSVAFHCCTAPSPTLPSAAPGNSWKRKGEQQQPELRPSLEVRSHLGRFSLHAWKQTAGLSYSFLLTGRNCPTPPLCTLPKRQSPHDGREVSALQCCPAEVMAPVPLMEHGVILFLS